MRKNCLIRYATLCSENIYTARRRKAPLPLRFGEFITLYYIYEYTYLISVPDENTRLNNLLAPQPLDGRRCVQCQATYTSFGAFITLYYIYEYTYLISVPDENTRLNNLLAPQPLDGRRCVQCQATYTSFGAFITLYYIYEYTYLISVPDENTRLNNLLAPQPLDGRRCVQCQATSSVLSTEFLMTPQAMALQLLRLRVTSSEVKKDASSVRLAPVTRLDGINWNITGVVNHSATLHQGHYTAYNQCMSIQCMSVTISAGSSATIPEWPKSLPK